jgi:hypothetical protein
MAKKIKNIKNVATNINLEIFKNLIETHNFIGECIDETTSFYLNYSNDSYCTIIFYSNKFIEVLTTKTVVATKYDVDYDDVQITTEELNKRREDILQNFKNNFTICEASLNNVEGVFKLSKSANSNYNPTFII